MRLQFCALLFAAGFTGVASADIVNGDFEAGNTGFTSGYSYRTVSSSPFTGQYGVVTGSFAWSGNFWNTLQADHTTGQGQFLIADTAPGVTIWQETTSVTPNTACTFSAWLATWTTFPAATVAVEINGAVVASWLGPAGATWTQYSVNWNSGSNTSATIRLYASTNVQPGGDVAIDDIRFVPTPGAGLALAALGIGGLARRRR
jgi:hypothetical protein